MNIPTFGEGSLVMGNQVRNNLGKPGGKDFGDDFVGEIQQANWSKALLQLNSQMHYLSNRSFQVIILCTSTCHLLLNGTPNVKTCNKNELILLLGYILVKVDWTLYIGRLEILLLQGLLFKQASSHLFFHTVGAFFLLGVPVDETMKFCIDYKGSEMV